MKRVYKTGFQRLAETYDTDARYAIAIEAIRNNYTGFSKKDGFKKTLTDSQKLQIRRYYNFLTRYTEGGLTYKMAVSDLPKEIKKGGKQAVKKAFQAVQNTKGTHKAKYLFIKYDGEQIPKLIVRNGVVMLKSSKADYYKEFIEINPTAITSHFETVKEKIRQLIDDGYPPPILYRIANDHSEFGAYHTLNSVFKGLAELQSKYPAGERGWNKFVTGINVYRSDKIDGFELNAEFNRRDEARRQAFKQKYKAAQKALKAKRVQK